MHEYCTTYLVNGNVVDIDKIMDGALETPRNETLHTFGIRHGQEIYRIMKQLEIA